MALLDALFSGGGLLPAFVNQPQPNPQGPTSPGLMDRLVSGFQGAMNSSSPMGALGNLVGGLSTGQRTDPAGAQQAGVSGMLNALVTSGQITPTQARFIAANPKTWEELGKAMINVPIQIAPDGSIIQSRPFGQLNVPGGVPISERGETVNPDGSKSPANFIKPSLQNPRGSIVTPTIPGAPAQAAPQGNYGGRPESNPNIRPVGTPVQRGPITSPSPQSVKENEGVGAGLADDYTKIQQRSAAASKTLTTLQRMSQLGDKAFEGALAPAQQMIRSALVSLGLPSNTVAKGEEFTALANKLTLDAMNGSLGAGVSNADVMFISNINPNLSHTVAGRKELISTLTALAKRDQEIAKEAVKYRSDKGSLDGFQNYIADWAEKRPLFKGRENTATFTDRFTGGAQSVRFGDGSTITEGATIRNPKTGERRIYKDGGWRPL